VDIAILAALNPKRLAGRGPRVGWQSGIDPGEVVEDANGADGLVDDVAAVTHFELLRERPHGARLALRVPCGRAQAAFEPGAGRTMRHRERRVPPIVQVRVGRRLDRLARVALVLRDLVPLLAPRGGKVLGRAERPVPRVRHHGLHLRRLPVIGRLYARVDDVRVRVRGRHKLRERRALLRVVEAAGEVDLQGSGQHALCNVHGLVVLRVGRALREGHHAGVPGRLRLYIRVGQLLERLTAAFRPGICREGHASEDD